MKSLHPYLNFDGKTEEAFNFYKSVFGGEFTTFQRFNETPQLGDQKMSDEDGKKMMHVALPLDCGIVLMGTDTLEGMGMPYKAGTNVSLTILPNDREEADRLFNGLSAGGVIGMPMAEQFWGAYYGNFTDKYGIQWMINLDKA